MNPKPGEWPLIWRVLNPGRSKDQSFSYWGIKGNPHH